MTLILSGSDGVTFPDSTEQETGYANGIGFRNRIINGDMRIDQRNAGASVTFAAGGGAGYPSDRWYVENFTDGTATVQQVTDAPTGFSNSIQYTVTGTDTSLASDQSAFIQQRIEGFNTADLLFGTASAKTVTVSFWVKSSVTGTFGGALANSAYNRGYPFTYSISVADTWEQKSVTIAGDITGTWTGSTNGTGLRISFALAAGSNRASTAGAWASYVGIGASGQVNLMASSGATLYITGVQLEVGSVATPFERRPYGTELALCQRYYQQFVQYGFTNGARSNGTTAALYSVPLCVELRSTPTVNNPDIRIYQSSAGVIDSSGGATTVTYVSSAALVLTKTGFTGLTDDRAYVVFPIDVSDKFTMSAEL